jgi:hypothetical protein
MKKIAVFLSIVVALLIVFQCEGKKTPTPPEKTDPKYYFVINVDYMWQYLRLGSNCIVTDDTIYIYVLGKNDRYIEEVQRSGWDMVTLPGGDTSFAYQVKDTMFYFSNVLQTTLPPYKILVGPVKAGTYWKDRPPYNYDYSIIGIEDLYSPIAGETYSDCAKVRRTSPDNNKVKYYWWSTEYGKVKEVEYQGEQCLQGLELKYLDKTSTIP